MSEDPGLYKIFNPYMYRYSECRIEGKKFIKTVLAEAGR